MNLRVFILCLAVSTLLVAGGGVGGCKDRASQSGATPPAPAPVAQAHAEGDTPKLAQPSARVSALLNSEQCVATTITEAGANHTVRMPLAVISGMERYDLRLAPEPALPPLNEPFTLRVTITERGSGKPVPAGESVALGVDAWMPEHLHGLTARPSILREGEGVYVVANLLLHMEGKWQMYFDITNGPLTERAQIDMAIQ